MPDVFDSSDTFDEWFSIGKHSGAGGTGEGVMSGEGGNENVIRKLHQVGREAGMGKVVEVVQRGKKGWRKWNVSKRERPILLFVFLSFPPSVLPSSLP